MRTLLAVMALYLLFAAAGNAAGIQYGMSRDEVQSALGKPRAILQRDGRQVLLYGKDGRVEFADGKAIEIKNLALDESYIPATGPIPTETTEATNSAATPAAPSDHRQSSPKEPPSSRPDTPADHDAEEEDNDTEYTENWTHFTLGLLVGGLCRTLIMIVVLKAAFHWADVHADWGQMIIPALSDTVVRAVLAASGRALLETDDLFHVDDALSYLALLFVLMKTTHACTLIRAVAVAGAAKLAGIVVGSLVTAALLHALAG